MTTPSDSKSSATIESISFERLTDATATPADELAPSLRPDSFAEYPGQHKAKANLQVYVKAAKARGKPIDHILLHGPPGLGKTTLAKIVAGEMGADYTQISGPAVDKPGDLAGILAGLEPGGVLFIDEIHRLSILVEEVLYSAMEDFTIDIVVGQGPTARTLKMSVPPFTLIGATTRVALLSAPLLSRFGIQERLQFYDAESLASIITRTAELTDCAITPEAAMELAGRSRGTPRIANRLLRRAQDFALFQGSAAVDVAIIKLTLTRLEIDEQGLDHMDIRILTIIRDRYGGGPVGLETLAATVGEVKSTVEEVYEPFLLHQGFLERGPRGRSLSPKGYDHLASL